MFHQKQNNFERVLKIFHLEVVLRGLSSGLHKLNKSIKKGDKIHFVDSAHL